VSNHYDLLCLDCNEKVGLWVNHGDKLIHELIKAIPAIAAMGKIMPSLTINVRDNFGLYGEVAQLESGWCAKHEGHRLTSVSEYGLGE